MMTQDKGNFMIVSLQHISDKNQMEYEYELWKSKNGEWEQQLLQATSRGPPQREREIKRE